MDQGLTEAKPEGRREGEDDRMGKELGGKVTVSRERWSPAEAGTWSCSSSSVALTSYFLNTFSKHEPNGGRRGFSFVMDIYRPGLNLPLGVLFASFNSSSVSFICASLLFSLGTRINVVPLYEAPLLSQISEDGPAGELLGRETDGQRRDGRQP